MERKRRVIQPLIVQDFAVAESDNALSGGSNFAVVGDNDQGDALLTVEFCEQRLYLGGTLTVEVPRWFIGEQNSWLVGQGTCDGHPLTLTA